MLVRAPERLPSESAPSTDDHPLWPAPQACPQHRQGEVMGSDRKVIHLSVVFIVLRSVLLIFPM